MVSNPGTTPAREAMRAQVFLRSVLPLVEVMVAEDPTLASQLGQNATVQIQVAGSVTGARLCARGGAIAVEQGVRPDAHVRCEFTDLRALNSFFAGRLALPRLIGALRHPLMVVGAARLLASLRILHPQAAPASPTLRALRVKLLLYLCTRALAELHRQGHPLMRELVDESPERVFQWTVQSAGIGAFLRMQAGRVKAGRGIYSRRRPFVSFVFPDPEAALAVLTTSKSQMSLVRGGQVQTLGSPEYTRKISLLMQKVDELLREG
jgi:hypothetical protein